MEHLLDCKDKHNLIKEESYLCDIEDNRLLYWKFERRNLYWSATVENPQDGLPLDYAMKLYHKPNPVNGEPLGNVIRCGGHGSGLNPSEYGANPIYDDNLTDLFVKLGLPTKEYDFGDGMKLYTHITVGEMSKLCNDGVIDVPRYVDVYHIDTLVGLKEFVKFLKTYYREIQDKK